MLIFVSWLIAQPRVWATDVRLATMLITRSSSTPVHSRAPRPAGVLQLTCVGTAQHLCRQRQLHPAGYAWPLADPRSFDDVDIANLLTDPASLYSDRLQSSEHCSLMSYYGTVATAAATASLPCLIASLNPLIFFYFFFIDIPLDEKQGRRSNIRKHDHGHLPSSRWSECQRWLNQHPHQLYPAAHWWGGGGRCQWRRNRGFRRFNEPEPTTSWGTWVRAKKIHKKRIGHFWKTDK